MALHKVLQTAYIGLLLYQPGEFVEYSGKPDDAPHLKKATAAELARLNVRAEEQAGEAELKFD